jgi:hypothetical protein
MSVQSLEAAEIVEIWSQNTMIPNISATTTKSEKSANKKKKTVGRTAKLKSSNWYHGAARSIGINKKKSLEKSR